MKKISMMVTLSIVIAVLSLMPGCERDGLQIVSPKCEYGENPISVDVMHPRLSWQLQSRADGQIQTAFQILAAGHPDTLKKNRGDLWDSGKITSNNMMIKYAGKKLHSNQTVYWCVRVWDKNNKPTLYSDIARFRTALLTKEDWQAKWIGRSCYADPDNDKGYYDRVPTTGPNDSTGADARSLLLRKEFSVNKPVKHAFVHVTGLGFYELNVNNQKIGDHALQPEKTFYRERVLYHTFDITSQLKTGENCLGMMLGNGWFNPLKKWWSWRMQWFGDKRAILQLHITYEDGTSEIVVTDETWNMSPGPVVSSCIYDGEIYDARLEQENWCSAGFDASLWKQADILPQPCKILKSVQHQPVKRNRVIKPKSVTKQGNGIYLVDMGQNFSGWLRLKIKGQKGDTVVIRYAENIHETGTIDRTSNNLALSTDTLILNGNGPKVYEPRFTYHGFRYAEITGYPNEPGKDDIAGVVVHSACAPVGGFDCGNALVNNIHRATLWSQKSNLMGLPTDCPQRDERLGWLGDAHVTADEAMFNFNMPLFYEKWLRDIKDCQDPVSGDIPYIAPRPFTDAGGDPAWSCGFHYIVWQLYTFYGDTNVLQDNYDAMKKYVDFLLQTSNDFILPKDKYGDWASPNETGWWERGMPESVSTGYFYLAADIVAKTAAVLNNSQDSLYYKNLAEKIKTAYNKKFFDPERASYENGTQFSNTFPLFLGIVPKEQEQDVLNSLVDRILNEDRGHIMTGILGTNYIFPVLSDFNRQDIAWLILTRSGYPGWADMLCSRTTLSEHWNQSGSNNHVMFGSVDAWFYNTLAGIRPDPEKPGFEHIIIKPYITPALSHVNAAVQTVRGTVSCKWELVNNNVRMEVVIPANSCADIYVPATCKDNILVNGKYCQDEPEIVLAQTAEKHAVLKVNSGTYHIISKDIKAIFDPLFVADPEIEPENGFIIDRDSVKIKLYSKTKDAHIYYTLDGSEPTEASTLYTSPFYLRHPAQINTKTYKTGMRPSFITRMDFEFVKSNVNGLGYTLYRGAWKKIPDFSQLEADKKGHCYNFDVNEIELPKHNFALEVVGNLKIDRSGIYTFYLSSNDGSRLFLNNNMIIDNDGEHGTEEKSADFFLEPGLNELKVHYFQSGGSKKLSLFYKGPDIPKQKIPSNRLYQ